jgi:RHS repeat-associated protein
VQPQGVALAHDATGGGSLDEQCQCADVPATGSAADPVDTATGDFYETRTDLTLPGTGVPLDFSRTYDAQVAQAQATAASTPPTLGYGWADNFGMNVSYDSSTQVATVSDENGAQTTYSPYVSGTSPAWCTGATNYCANAPRVEATLNQNGDGSWTLVRTTGGQSTFTFDSSGALTTIADATGDTVSSSTYSPTSGQTDCPTSDTCQAWTSSASGRELILATNSASQLAEVFDANSSLSATFAYSGSGCSTWSSSPTDLCEVVDPGNLTEAFTYDSSNPTSDLDYDMLTDTPPAASGETVNEYNSTGQITQQTAPNGAVTAFAYAGNNATLAGGTTTVTNYPSGTGTGEPQDVTVDTYSNNVLIGVTTGSGTASASSEIVERDNISLLPTVVQNGDGSETTNTYQTYSGTGGTEISSANVLTSTDAMGNTTAYAYNAFNQAWCSIEPAYYANGITCPSTEPTSPPSPRLTDPYLGATINYYNSSDQLTATTDALGNTTLYAYTSGVSGVPDGLLYCSVDPVSYQGGVTCPSYGATPVEGTTTHTFDSAGDNLTSSDALGNTTTYVYAAPGLPGVVSSETDPNGTTTSFTYDAAGLTTTQVVSFGSYSATTEFAYDAYGRQFCSVAPNEYAQSVTCPTSAPSTPPTLGSDPYLGATITSYNANGQVVQVTNPLGGITLTAYDDAGNIFCTVSPRETAASVTCPSSAPSTPPTPGSDPYLGATITTFNANNRVVQVTNPLGGITLTTYDGAGNVLSTTVETANSTADPNVVATHVYNLDNQVTSTTVDAGTSIAATTLNYYDPNGDIYCTVSANAFATGGSQCPQWQVGWIAAPPNPTSLYSTSPTSAQANEVTTYFDDANAEQLQSTNPDVATSISAYDGDGRTYCTSNPVNVGTWLTANPSGTYPYNCPSSPPSTAPSSGSNPGYVTTIYDADGHASSTTNQLGDTTSYSFDASGNALTTADPRGEITTSCYYDENGAGQCAHGAPSAGGTGDNLYSTTAPDTTADPSGEETTFTYYPGGATDTTTTPAATETSTYDAQGDLLSTSYSAVSSGYTTPATTSRTYNADGTQATMIDASGATTYSYDAAGDITQQAFVAGSGTDLADATTSYTYYNNGNEASVTYPFYTGSSDPVANYDYDATGAMISTTDWLGNTITFSHDFDGNQISQDNNVSTSNPTGTSSTTFAYDAADETSSDTSSFNQTCGSSETLTQSFGGSGGSRNADGQLTKYSTNYSDTCSGQTSRERNYSYDLAGQVVYQGSTVQGSNSNNFAFDPSGDLTTISSHDASGNFDTYTQTFDSAGEVLTQSPVTGSDGATSTYAYDTLGDLTSATSTATTTYAHNAEGQMTSVTTPSGAVTYLYQGDGLEASATAPGTVPSFWNAATDIDSTRALDAVTCTSSTFCVAVGASGYATTYNGTSWAAPTDIDSTRTMGAVSCTSSTFCVAVGTAGYAAIYTGTWAAATDIDSTRALDAVTCTSSTFCVAVGASGYATTYNGTTWATATKIDSTRTMDAVSCTSATFCVAVDSAGYATIYNGISWSTPSDADSTRSISDVTCPSTTLCFAVDTSGYATTYNGSSWATATDVDGSRSISAVICPSTTLCVAVDTSGYATTYNGSSWATATDVDGSNSLRALSCASTTSCNATDADGNVVAFNGSAWSGASDIDAARSISAISCPSATFCAAVGSSGYGALFAPTSPAWNDPVDVDSTRALSAVTCTSSTFCAAVGSSGYATTYNGTSWSTPSDIDSTRALSAVTCTSSTFCVAVDTSGYATTYNGTSWSTPSDIDSTRSLNAVTCTSSTFCVAVGASGYATTYNGTSWTAAKIDSTRTMNAVSCTSSTFCYAVGTAGYAVEYTGTWAAAADIDSTRAVDSISCLSTTFCVAVGASGYSTTYNGTSWATAIDADSSRTMKVVTCPSTTLCVAVDSSGYATTYGGTSWATPIDVDGSHALQALSCGSTALCGATDAYGNAFTFNGSTWSNATDVDDARSVLGISCPSATFCVAVDSSGEEAAYQVQPPTPVVSQLTWDTNGPLGEILSDGFNDYIYGPSASPVEQVNLANSAVTYMTYTLTDSTWFASNEAGDETGFYGYDAFGNLAFGTPNSAFGYADQYTDSASGFSNLRARFYDSQVGTFNSRDADFSATDSAYVYAGDDPVNGSDPTGLYQYTYAWYLGQESKLGGSLGVFNYFSSHLHSVFPFPTGNCSSFTHVGEACVFLPGSGTDHLHVSSLGSSSVTLTVDNWCQSPGRGATGICIAGDAPGSTISFLIGEWYGHVSTSSSCNTSNSGWFDFLAQTGHSPDAGPLTNVIAPIGAIFAWHQQALNLAKGLGGNPNDVALITGPGWSSGLPF